MADRQISELPTVSTVDDNIQFPVSQNDTAMKLLIADLKAHFANYVSSDIETKVSDAIDDWFAEHGDFGGKLCVIDATSTPFTSSMTYNQIYKALVTDRQSVMFLFLDSGSSEYVTSLAYIDSGSVRAIFIMPKTDGTYPVIYVDITSANAVTISTDVIGSGSGASSDIVVLTLDENNNVYNGSTAIKGSQINALAETGKAVFVWDGNNHRLFAYSTPNGSGSAQLISSLTDGNGCYVLTVGATVSSATLTQSVMLPVVTASDDGMILGVQNGVWSAVQNAAANVVYDIYAEVHTSGTGNYYTFTGGVNSSTIYSALSLGMLPIARNNDNQYRRKWYFSDYNDDGEDVYIQFFRVTGSGVEVLRYVESEGRAYVSTV